MVVQGVDDRVMTEGDFLALVAVAGEVMPCIERNRILRSAGGTVVWKEGVVRA